MSESAAPLPGAITLLRDGLRLGKGGALNVEWNDWGRRVEAFLKDYDEAIATIQRRNADRKADY